MSAHTVTLYRHLAVREGFSSLHVTTMHSAPGDAVPLKLRMSRSTILPICSIIVFYFETDDGKQNKTKTNPVC